MSESPPHKKKRKTETLNDRPAVANDLPDSICYKALSVKFPELKPFLIPTQGDKGHNRCSIDFKDPEAVRTLNRALLSVYFGLDVTLPQDSLCPKVANRLNYVCWIKNSIGRDFPLEPLRGLDVGTGASCIYPLLGARVLKDCSFVATDINAESVRTAVANVERNGLLERIQVYLNSDSKTKLPLDRADFPGIKFTFSMCNPPFYSSEEEREALRNAKAKAPSLSTLAKTDELFTEGGEERFLSDMADESKVFGDRIAWYTTMVGKKRTLGTLKAKLATLGAKQIREGTLVQGRTSRWVVAWSFIDKRVFSVDVCRMDRPSAWTWFKDIADQLGIIVDKAEGEYWKCSAMAMTWTRRARRQKNRDHAPPQNSDLSGPPVVTFLVTVVEATLEGDVCRGRGSTAAAPPATGTTSTIRMYLTSDSGSSSALRSLYNYLLRKQRDDGLDVQ